MNEQDLKNEINKWVAKKPHGEYSKWYIGVTDNPDERKASHQSKADVSLWKDWQADIKTIARDVEEYFYNRGMKGAGGGGTNPRFVYIY